MKVVSTRSLDEALRALRDATADSRVLAGGTDLMVELETGRTRPDLVVDVWRLAELRGIAREDGGVRIGALASCAELEHSPIVRGELDILAAAAATVGAEQIKNRATLGGNLGTASPAADVNPVLLALGARVRLRSLRGARELPVAEFLTGYRKTARAHDELIESVWIERRPAHEQRFFRKVGTRRAQAIAKVVLAGCVRVRGARVESLDVAAGSVAERTLLLATLASMLVGRELEQGTIAAAARASALQDCTPQSDVRSTAEYRRAVVERVLARELSRIAQDARSAEAPRAP